MRRLMRAVVLAGALLPAALASGQATATQRLLAVAVHPSILARLPDTSHARFVTQLVRREGVEGNVTRQKDGTFLIEIASAPIGAAAAQLPRKIAALPGILASGWAKSSEEKSAHELKILFTKGTAPRNVIGFIVKYRSEALALRSRANEPLTAEELARFTTVTGLQAKASRAMSGDAFVIDLVDAINLPAALSIQNVLEADPRILHVSLNALVQAARVPDDPFFPQQWSLGSAPAGINAAQAWDITTGDPATVVAVVDTGILPHPDIAKRLLPGYDFISNPNQADDGDGRDNDPTDRGDWEPAGFCGPGSPYRPSSWHGLHVAGIIGAQTHDGYGMAGVDWAAKIVPVRVLGACGGALADVVDGMRWAAGLAVPGVPPNANPARVINMSLGGPTPAGATPPNRKPPSRSSGVGRHWWSPRATTSAMPPTTPRRAAMA